MFIWPDFAAGGLLRLHGKLTIEAANRYTNFRVSTACNL